MRTIKFLLLWCCASFGLSINAQETANKVSAKYDSLWDINRESAKIYIQDELENGQFSRKETADLFFKLSRAFFFNGKLDSTLYYLESATSIYQKAGLDSLQFESIFQSGVYCRRFGDIPLARHYYEEALELAKATDQTLLEADALNALGVAHYSVGEMVTALNYYLEAMQILEKAEAAKKLGKVYNNVGIIYKLFNHYERALYYYHKAAKSRIAANQLDELYMVYYNFNNLYYTINESEKALNASKKLLKIGIDNNNDGLQYGAYGMLISDYLEREDADSAQLSIDNYAKFALDAFDSARVEQYTGQVYLLKDEPVEAIKLFQKSLKVFRDYDFYTDELETLLYLSEGYFAFKDFKKAIKYAQESLSIAKKNQKSSFISSSLEQLHKLYLASGDSKKAYEYLTKARQRQDSIYNESKASIAGGMEASQKLAEQEKNNLLLQKNAEIQEQTIQNQRILVAGAIAVTILIVVVAYLLIRTQANKKRLAEIEAQVSRDQANRIEEELAYKNQEIINFAVQITEKNEFLEKLNDQVKKLNGRAKELPEELKQIVELVKAHFSITEQREEFHQHVENVYDAFFQRLENKYPGLSISEKRLAALIRINLTSKDIASVVNISPKSVDMNRYRLRKKMGLDSEDNLNDILQKL